MTKTTRRVAVIGAGVIGATVAARIAESGIDVALLSAEPVGTTAVSRASFAWVNSHAKEPEAYRRLNEDGRRRHAERSDAHARGWFLRTGAEIDGVEYADDGYVDTRAFLAAQLDDLRRAGGTVHEATRVDALEQVPDIVGPVDTIVVAAGAGTSSLVAPVAPDTARVAASTGDDGFLARIRVDEHPIDRIRSRGRAAGASRR